MKFKILKKILSEYEFNGCDDYEVVDLEGRKIEVVAIDLNIDPDKCCIIVSPLGYSLEGCWCKKIAPPSDTTSTHHFPDRTDTKF